MLTSETFRKLGGLLWLSRDFRSKPSNNTSILVAVVLAMLVEVVLVEVATELVNGVVLACVDSIRTLMPVLGVT